MYLIDNIIMTYEPAQLMHFLKVKRYLGRIDIIAAPMRILGSLQVIMISLCWLELINLFLV